MPISFTRADENSTKINTESPGINKKYLISLDSKSGDDKIEIHNRIHNRYIAYVQNNKKMNDDYFKTVLMCVYKGVFDKSLVFKNIPDSTELKENLNKLLNNTSFYKAYLILQYYSTDTEKDTFTSDQLIDLTALFYSTLLTFVKIQSA